jgi:hypothetical protein
MAQTHTGNCFCGEVELEVTGEPKVMGYCHCSSCRSAGPVSPSGSGTWQALTGHSLNQQQSIHSIFLSEVSFECIGPQLFGVTFARSRTSGNPIGDRLFNFGGQRLTAFFF